MKEQGETMSVSYYVGEGIKEGWTFLMVSSGVIEEVNEEKKTESNVDFLT